MGRIWREDFTGIRGGDLKGLLREEGSPQDHRVEARLR
jgi:hypothetical protein